MTNVWDNATPNTLWRITGRVSDKHSFTDCAAIVLPHSVTGGGTVFAMLPPLDYVVTPSQITAAREYATVPAEHMHCDGDCSYNTGPAEDCSLHGRPVREVWGIVDRIAAERDQVKDVLARVWEVLAPHPVDHDGDDPCRVDGDYMLRAQAADEAWAILNNDINPTNKENNS